MNQRPTAVIVAPPGLLREGLRAALDALCRPRIVGEADTATHAITMAHDPALVVLSVQDSETDSLAAIGTLKTRWPAVRCIVLVDTVAQQRAAWAAGADESLIKGVRPDKLLRRVEALLGEKEWAFSCGHGSEA